MQLNTFPPELFESLARYWDGRHIIKFLMTGNKRVSHLLAEVRGIRHFVWTGRPYLQQIPTCLSRLRNLRTVRLKLTARNAIVLGYYPMINFPPSLESLDVDIRQSILMFFPTPPTPSDLPESPIFGAGLEDRLPNLHTIRVEDSDRPMGPFLVQHASDAVTNITVLPYVFSGRRTPPALPATPFSTRLPAHLEHLELHSAHFLRDDVQLLSWPPHLTVLRLPKCHWPAIPAGFPHTLTELQLGLAMPSNFLTSEEIDTFRPIFSNMRVLKLNTSQPYAFLQVLSRDSALETLTFSNEVVSLGLDDVMQLPSHLKRFSAYIERACGAHLYKHLPRTLEHFELKCTHEYGWKMYDTVLSELPATLQSFHATSTTPIPSSSIHLLPRTLTECSNINPTLLSKQAIRDLPRTIQTLVFPHEGRRLPFDNADMASLPDSLHTLIFENTEESISDRGLANLPRQLKTLIHKTNTSFSNSGMALLPPMLTILHLPQNGSIADSGIARLPQTLTELVLEGDEHMLTTKCFKTLPRHLKGLSIKKLGAVSDIAMQDLPQSITSLILPGAAGISNKVFLYLPRQVRRLVLRNNTTLSQKCLKSIHSELEFLNIKENPNFELRLNKKVPKNLPLLTKMAFFKSPAFVESDLVSTQL